jgi:tight adherence protein B
MAVGLGAAIACLFYRSFFGLLVVPPLYVILRHRAVDAGRGRVQEELAKEFLDALRTVSAALLAGFSMENAWREAQKEIGALYGKEAPLYRELEEMNQSVSFNIPLEQLIESFATRSGNADIASFAEVFAFAKRSGGNFVTIIAGTSEHMRAKYETEREISVLVASRKMEQKIMNVIPMLILAYLGVTSMDFLDVLYGNAAGVLFMTACLLAYGGAVLLAERILRIKM